MKNKKLYIKITIIILILILIIIGTLLLINIIIKNSNRRKIEKGYQIFGYEYCNGHYLSEPFGHAFTEWSCKICGYHAVHSNTATPTICSKCAQITSRCSRCGKLVIPYKVICRKNGYNYNKIISNYNDYNEFINYIESVDKDDNKVFEFNPDTYADDFFETKSLAIMTINNISVTDNLNLSINNDELIYKIINNSIKKEEQKDSIIILVEIDKSIKNFHSKY